MRIIVTTFYDQNYKPLAEKTNPNHQAYCDRHGYNYCPMEINNKFQGTGYQALCEMGSINAQVVIKALSKMRPDSCLFTIGCDAVITRMDFKLEELVKFYHGFDVLTGSDWDGVNSSQMFIKNTPRVREYFEDMVKWIEAGGEHDQAYLKNNPKDFIIPTHQGWMNSYDHELRLEEFDPKKHWGEGSFLVHLAGSTLEQRMGVIDKWLGRVK